MMTGHQAKQALDRSTPYVTLGNLIAMCALVVMMIQGGILDFSGGIASAADADVSHIETAVTGNSNTIEDLRRESDRLERQLQTTERWVGQRLDRIENKVDGIYKLLIQRDTPRRRSPPG